MKFIFLVKEFLLIFTVAVLLSLNSCNRAYANSNVATLMILNSYNRAYASSNSDLYVDEIQKEKEYKYFICIQNEDGTCYMYRFKEKNMLWKNKDGNATSYVSYKRAKFKNFDEMKKTIKSQNIEYEKASAYVTISTKTDRTLCSNFTIKTDDNTIEIKAHNYKNKAWTDYNDGELFGMAFEDLYANTVEALAACYKAILVAIIAIVSFRKVTNYVKDEVKRV